MFPQQKAMKILVPRKSTLKMLLLGLLFGIVTSLTILHLRYHRTALDLQRFSSVFDGVKEEDPKPTPKCEPIKRMDQYDYSMKYKIIPFAFVSPEWTQKLSNWSVCIATHASANRMHSLAESLLSWKKSASVAVFVYGEDVQIVQQFLGFLQFCFPEALHYVAIHLVHSVERPPIESLSPDEKTYNCKVEPKTFIDELLETSGMSTEGRNESEKIYPQNILRNTAIRMCPTEWILPVDVDMLPNPSLEPRLEKFLAQEKNHNCSKCIFAIPTYEVKLPKYTKEMVKRIPDTKEELLSLINKGSARPFHKAIFQPNQGASKLNRWEKLPELPEDEIDIAYAINYTFWYEPIFVAKRGFPLYDERFLGFGMTRNTQAYEMFLSGYQFMLLDNAFLTHWGFQGMGNRPAWRYKQTSYNSRLFSRWLLEKTIRYDKDPLNLTNTMVHNKEKRNFRITQNIEMVKT